MPGVITGIINGIQGSNAAHDAAKAQVQGYTNAASTVNTAVGNANPLIGTAAQNAATGVTGAASSAGRGALDAASAAGAGVTGAAGSAAQGVTDAAGGANSYLNPYLQGGASASQALSNLNLAGGFSFNPQDLQNTPGYQFQLQQGNRGITANAAAAGLVGSGATAKALANYDQGLAGTTYNQQYQNALQGYNANLNTFLPQASMGLNAAGAAGSNLLNAAQYGGNVNLAGQEYAGNAGQNAAQYAGTTGLQGAQYAGDIGFQGANEQASNLINAGLYTGNTQIASGNAIAQGDIGAANSWSNMLNGIGQAGNTIAGLGFGSGGGWSFGNIGSNLGNLNSFGGFGNLGGAANYGNAPGSYLSGIGG